MKRKFTFILTAVLLLVSGLMLGQTRTTQELTFPLTSNPGNWPTTNSTTLTDYVYTLNEVDYTFSLRNVKCNSGYLMMTQVAALGLPAIDGYKLITVEASNSNGCSTSVKVGISSSGTEANYIEGGAIQTWSTQGSSYTYNLTSTDANTMYYLYVTNKNAQVTSLTLTYESTGGGGQQTVATPTFTPAGGTYGEAQNVTISCSTDGASIYYTTDGTTPVVEMTGINGTLYENPIGISQSTTLKAIAVKTGMNNSSVATATYTIQQLSNLTTISGIWDFAESVGTTSTMANVTFNNWYVTGIRNSQVCVSDGEYGFVIYQAGHGFAAGDKLSGTVTCNVLMYQNHYAELTGVTATDLTVVSGQEMPILTTTISALQVRNYGTPINLGTLTYEDSKFKDADGNTVTPYNNFNLSPNPVSSLLNNKQYNVKGVSIVYWQSGNPIMQVAPRSADDFEEVIAPTYYTVSIAEGITNGTVTANPTSATEGTTITITATPSNGYELETLTYSYTGATPIDIKETKQFTMPASNVTVNGTFSEIVLETVDTPTFSPVAGTYTEAQTVTISCTTQGASIYYTTDGTTPSYSATNINGTLYQNAFPISESTTVKAIAVKEGMNNSEIATAVYTINLAPVAQEKSYTMITNANALVSGGKYIIVGFKSDGSAKAMGKQATNNRVAVDVVTDENVITIVPATTNTDGIFELTLGQEDGKWTLYDTVNGGYLYAASSSSNYLKVQAENDANGQWTIEIASDGVATIKAQGTNTRNWLRLNTNGTPFSCYASGQLNVYLFKAGDIPTPPTEYNVNIAEGIANGTVTANPTTATEGTTINVTATPSNGYELSTLTYSYTGSTPIDIKETKQFTMPAADVTINASFTELAHVATPTFSPAAGSYITAQSVSIACATEGATVYYTIDGTTPTTESSVYGEPITVSETTTVKAIAVKNGLNDSEVSSAIYTIIQPVTIASARALLNNEYALVQGVVTFMDGRNIYVQDETAGIDLYLNSNTIPEALAIGDMVLAYGKKTVYNGLVELTSIAGNNTNQFMILSSNNVLPVAVKTIAEILADNTSGANMLQSTRVQIVNATLGTINNSNNTPITQDGNTLNIYKLPVVEGLEEGDFVTVVGVLGCYNSPQLRVNSANDVEFSHPAGITITPTSLSGFNYVYEEGPSTVKNFSISGRSLTAPTYIIASENYEISSFPGEAFYPESQITINTYTGVYNYSIKVRLKAGLEVGTYEESLTVCQAEVDTMYVALSGSVTEQPQPGVDYVRISDLSQIGNGSKVIFAARYNENANEYYAMTAQASGKPTGVLFTSEAGTANEVLPSSITDEESTYYWTVSTDGANYTFTNANGDVLGYTSSTNFATGGENINWTIAADTSEATAMVPEYSAFVISNANVTNRAFALNSSHNYGPYHTQNMAADNYNFFIDLFVTAGGTPTCATPTFNPEGGTYFEEQTVVISCGTANATIYYTLDGSDPTAESDIYTGPIVVASNTTIKAFAVKEGFNDSGIAEAEYTIILGTATIFNQDWEGDMNGWTFVTVEGNNPWTIAQYSGNHYAYSNGYNGGANEQWCISPAFNLDNYENVTLTFRTAMNYTGPDLELFFSNDYDGATPASATWTELEFNKSTGSFAWVESGAISFTGFAGTNCYIGFKYISTDDQAAAWEVDDINLVGVTSNPTLSTSVNGMNGFVYTEGNGPSAEQSFTLTGMNLTEEVTLTIAGEGFEMSETSGDDFDPMDEIVVEPNNGLVELVVYVRLAEGLVAGSYTGTITVTSELDDITVSLNGTVNEQVQSGNWNRISALADLQDGDQLVIASRYDANIGDGYYAMTAGVSGKPEGVLFTSVNDEGIEMLPDEIVNDITTYMWNVTVSDTIITLTNNAGESLGYSSSTNFSGNTNTDWAITYASAGENTMIPGYNGFVITNMTTTNRGIAKNSSNNYGAYSTSNINNTDYNFYLDLFVLGGSASQTVATPVFSMASGTYYEEIDVEISCTTEDATIYYTTDGSDPTAESMIYEEAIHVSHDMTIKAIAMKEGYENSGIATANYEVLLGVSVILNQDWEGEMNGWTFVTVEGNKPWNVSSYGGNHYAYANGYNDETDNEQWCISPAFDLTYFTDVTLTFRNAKNYSGPDLELYISNNYDGQDPTAATWHSLAFEMSAGGYAWTESGEISLDGYSGENCYIGFRYISTIDPTNQKTVDRGAAAWEIDDIQISGKAYDAVDETESLGVNIWNYNNEIFIENHSNGNLQLRVFNILGQQVYAQTVCSGNVRFSHNLAKGLYVVTLQNGKGCQSSKMIVK